MSVSAWTRYSSRFKAFQRLTMFCLRIKCRDGFRHRFPPPTLQPNLEWNPYSTIRRPRPLLSTFMALRRLNTIFSKSSRKSSDEESRLGRSPTYRTSFTRAPSYTTHAAGPSHPTNPEIDANLSAIEEMSSVVRTSVAETSSVAGTIMESRVRSGPRYGTCS